jgi:cellulose biosynthesis protein BcsQ
MKAIVLEFNNKKLEVKFEQVDEYIEKEYIPLFKEFKTIGPTPKDLEGAPVIAFHSYKGGVGRTLSLISTINSFSSIRKADGKSYKLLIVDADIEAPGLTWLASANSNLNISYLDSLAMVHENDNWKDEVIKFVAKKIRESVLELPIKDKVIEHYFLPAYRIQDGEDAISQILNMPAIPENLVQMTERQWIIGDFLSLLGKELDVDAVLIDLRAGISDFSAPILLDPRIRKIYVSSTSLQSRKGVNTLLKEIYRSPIDVKYPEPYVLISMVHSAISSKETSKMQAEILDGVEIFDSQKYENNLDEVDIKFEMLPFAEELVHLEGFDMIYDKLMGTGMAKKIDSIVKSWMELAENIMPEKVTKSERKFVLEKLNELTEKMEYAENNETSNFLVTAAIKNLVRKFKYEVPKTVILGAKGSGKTFIYSQLIKYNTWEKFVNQVEDNDKIENETFIVPFLKPSNISDTKYIENQIKILSNELGIKISLKGILQVSDRIKNQNADNEVEWKTIWKRELLSCLGINISTFEQLQEYLSAQGKRIIFVVDGIEDMFQNLTSNKNEKKAFRALVQDIVNEIRSIPDSRIGIIIFSRFDIAMNSIEQNFGQFKSQYSAFELKWTNVEALKLILWIVSKIKNRQNQTCINIDDIDIETAVQEVIITKLYKLWGVKLGQINSKEGNSAKWVLAALSVKEQLQPRDVIRFLKYSSKENINETEKNNSEDRYLTPSSMRKAIKPCSKDKIEEIKKEMEFIKVIFEKMEASDKKQMPFRLEQLNLTIQDAEILSQHGYLYEFEDEYYMPEIIRHGLGFESTRKGRKRILSVN